MKLSMTRVPTSYFLLLLVRIISSSWSSYVVIAQGLPSLPLRDVKTQSTNLPVVAAAAAPEEKKFLGVPVFTLQKIIPLGLMFFCILFNYTILRDTKVSATSAITCTMACLLGSRVQIGLCAWRLRACCLLMQWLLVQVPTSLPSP
jgi:hypothetical protein